MMTMMMMMMALRMVVVELSMMPQTSHERERWQWQAQFQSTLHTNSLGAWNGDARDARGLALLIGTAWVAHTVIQQRTACQVRTSIPKIGLLNEAAARQTELVLGINLRDRQTQKVVALQ
jgi:hypothetical protein